MCIDPGKRWKMKIVHVLKKIEMIDQDIKELKKLEKTIQQNKSFSTPIYMSIEKQINIMLGERIKLLDLKIENPPATLVSEIEGVKEPSHAPAPAPRKPVPPASPRKANRQPDENDDLPMLTQDQIDARFDKIKAKPAKPEKKKKTAPAASKPASKKGLGDGVKILDIALEKGTLRPADEDEKPDGEKKVRFFRDNFPVD